VFDLDIGVLQLDSEAVNHQRQAAFHPPLVAEPPAVPLHLLPPPDTLVAAAITEEAQLAAVSQMRINQKDPREESNPQLQRSEGTKRINAFTPPRPPEKTNQQVLWQSWSVHQVPVYSNGVACSAEEALSMSVPLCYPENCGMDKLNVAESMPPPSKFTFRANKLDGVAVHQEEAS
jgi:hypothetical protein